MQQARLSGEAGAFVVGALKDAVDKLRFEGATLDLWIGRGLLFRPWVVKGDERAVRILHKWLTEHDAA